MFNTSCFRCPGDFCDKKEDSRFLSIVKNKVSLTWIKQKKRKFAIVRQPHPPDPSHTPFRGLLYQIFTSCACQSMMNGTFDRHQHRTTLGRSYAGEPKTTIDLIACQNGRTQIHRITVLLMWEIITFFGIPSEPPNPKSGAIPLILNFKSKLA